MRAPLASGSRATLVVTGLCTAYILWKIDLGKTVDILRDAELGYFVGCGRDHGRHRLADGLALAAAARRRAAIHDRLALADARVLLGVHGGQVLPTSVGGDAMRIFETTRRHPGPRRAGRGLGAARAGARRRGDARARRGRLRARDRRSYDVGALPLGRARVRRRDGRARASCSSRARLRAAARAGRVPLLRRLRRRAAAARRLRGHPRATATTSRLLVGVFVLTLAIQAVRVLAIWLTGEGGRRRPLAARRTT